MAKDDQLFLFDTNPFEQGIKRIADAMMKLPKTASKVANGITSAFTIATKGMKGILGGVKKIVSGFFGSIKKIKNKFTGIKDTSQNVTKGVVAGIKKMVFMGGLLALAFKGVQGILKDMPEIGKAFGIAKDVLLKNLLFPLRKAIFPYLQKMLDWVRDNRLQFVKWGQVLSNVFKVVGSSIKFVIDMGKKIVSAFSGFFERTFGVAVTNITDMMNVLSFKFAIIMTFLQTMISKLIDKFKPALETLGEVFSELIEGVISFVEGFVEGFAEIDKQYGIIEEINSLFKEMKNSLETLSPILKPLGKILGKVFGITLLAALRTIESVLIAISGLIDLVTKKMSGKEFIDNLKTKGLGKFFTKGGKETSVKDAIINSTGKIIRTSPSQTIVTRKVNDAIITKDGKIVQTAPDDNLIATKNNVMLGDMKEKSSGKVISLGGITIDFSGMQIILQNGTKEEAANAGNTIVDTIRRTLQQELEAIGEY